MNTGTIPELRDELLAVEEIDRTTLNSWEDPDLRATVEVTGRKKVIMTGCGPRRASPSPTLDMIRAG